MRFSDRIGITKTRDSIQIDSMDAILSNKLWNILLSEFYYKLSKCSSNGRKTYVNTYALLTWSDYLNKPIDEFNSSASDIYQELFIIKELKKHYLKSNWYDKYNLLEFVIPHANSLGFESLVEKANQVLESEASGFRIRKNKIIPIYDNLELNAIDSAFENSNSFSSVNTHLETALSFISNREKPDYRNSIKESISAVEALLKIISKHEKKKFSDALAEFDKKVSIHPSLKKAFGALYGYTSDSGGIRHNLLEDDIEVTFEDAKFMLVSCSAFINYLRAKDDSIEEVNHG